MQKKMWVPLLPKKAFLTDFLESKHFGAPKESGALGCSLPCLCIKTALVQYVIL